MVSFASHRNNSGRIEIQQTPLHQHPFSFPTNRRRSILVTLKTKPLCNFLCQQSFKINIPFQCLACPKYQLILSSHFHQCIPFYPSQNKQNCWPKLFLYFFYETSPNKYTENFELKMAEMLYLHLFYGFF